MSQFKDNYTQLPSSIANQRFLIRTAPRERRYQKTMASGDDQIQTIFHQIQNIFPNPM